MLPAGNENGARFRKGSRRGKRARHGVALRGERGAGMRMMLGGGSGQAKERYQARREGQARRGTRLEEGGKQGQAQARRVSKGGQA